MCGYYGALTEQFEQPVMTLALYLKPRRSPIPNEYVVTLGEQVVNRFTYPPNKKALQVSRRAFVCYQWYPLASTVTAADSNVVIAITSGNLRFWLVAGETIMVCCEIHSVGHAAALTGIGGLSTEVMGMVSAMEGE